MDLGVGGMGLTDILKAFVGIEDLGSIELCSYFPVPVFRILFPTSQCPNL